MHAPDASYDTRARGYGVLLVGNILGDETRCCTAGRESEHKRHSAVSGGSLPLTERDGWRPSQHLRDECVGVRKRCSVREPRKPLALEQVIDLCLSLELGVWTKEHCHEERRSHRGYLLTQISIAGPRICGVYH